MVALWVTMAETDRLVAGAVPPGSGASRTVSGLQSPDAAALADSWSLWQGLPQPEAAELGRYLQAYAVADALFALAYFTLLWQTLRQYRWLRALVVAVLGSELGESVALSHLSTHFHDGGAAQVLAVLAMAKWALLALLLISVFYYRMLRRLMAVWLRRTRQAVLLQRLSVVAVLAVAAMALIPIPGVSDQLPDAQRAWAPEGLAAPRWWLAVLVALAGSAGLFVLGRRRSELAWALYVTRVPKQQAELVWWWYGPALLVGGLILAAAMGRIPLPPSPWMLPFLAVPAIVALLTLLLGGKYPSTLPRPWPRDEPRAINAWRCGDVLACSFLVVSGVALIRTFTGPVLLGAANGGQGPYGWSALFLAIGWLVVLAAFPAMSAFLGRTWRIVTGTVLSGILDPTTPATPAATRASYLTLVFAAVAMLFLLTRPAETTRFLGVPATAVVCVLAWTVVVGFLVIQLQQQRAVWTFEKLGLRANPIVSLVLLVITVTSLGGGDPRIHSIRQAEGSPVRTTRPAVPTYVDQWLAANGGCQVAVPTAAGTVNVRPVVFVAAQGGGIRAASWTADALGRLAGIPCGAQSVILSSGVSGGSLGLVVTQLYGPGESAVAVVDRLAGPEALAAGVAGALAGDLVAGGTDVLVGTGPATDAGAAWQDRAGAMERTWELAAGRLAEAWEPADPANGRTGALVLNSTAAGIGCRLLISQLDLSGAAGTQSGYVAQGAVPRNESCREGPAPLSIDLLAGDACPLHLSWSTAAMLSARFPIISPAGRIPYRNDGECGPDHAYQAIDGGYSEGSGLGTIHDLWPMFRDALTLHNSRLPDGQPFAVPVFLYLQNSAGSDVVARPPALAGEFAVPLLGISAKNLQSEATSWIQRLDADADVCPSAAELCAAAEASFSAGIGGSTVRVSPASRPALDPPLGWTLSPLSRERLQQAMDAETTCPSSAAQCPAFARLLAALRG